MGLLLVVPFKHENLPELANQLISLYLIDSISDKIDHDY